MTESLTTLRLQNADGEWQELGRYFAERPVIVVLLRHFG